MRRDCYSSSSITQSRCLHLRQITVHLEDGPEADFGGRREAEHGKVPDEPWCDRVPPATWRGTGGTQSHVSDLFPEELLSVVEAPEVLVLPKQLDGGLRAIRVQLGHVEVVHKDHYLLPRGSACWGEGKRGEGRGEKRRRERE